MTEPLAGRVRAMYASSNFDTGVPALLDLLHEDGVIRSRRFPGLEGEYRGHDGARRFFAELEDAFGRWRFDAESFEEHPGAFVVTGRIRAEGGHSGLQVDQPFCNVVRHDGERITAIDGYRSREEAVAALAG